MIGRERTGILSTNHLRAFRHSISKAETGFKSFKDDKASNISSSPPTLESPPSPRFARPPRTEPLST